MAVVSAAAVVLDLVVDCPQAVIKVKAVKLVKIRVHFFDFILFSSPSFSLTLVYRESLKKSELFLKVFLSSVSVKLSLTKVLGKFPRLVTSKFILNENQRAN